MADPTYPLQLADGYLVDRCVQNKLRHPVDSLLFDGR